jgi:DNA invertase Pin-like site-specific DNA recombinase/predicted DNA-binding protein (MmcQ/YjbR family)
MNVKRLERTASSDQATSAKKIWTKATPPTASRLRTSSKIGDHHSQRLAIVYIRQSSPHQVLENRESRERQYALATLAQEFGWPADRVLVIDEDQGVSGKFSENRSGFQRLLNEVTMDHVGLVLGLELSRLARSCKDWHHLVEVCAVFDTLLYDQDGIYDANDSNDRLLLGMKGAMSEFELITLRNRLERGRDNKAARGDLFLHLPIGYVKSPSGEVLLEPDEQARGVVQLVFDKFEELGTAWGVFRYLIRNKIQLGYRCHRGSKSGQLEWRRPVVTRILAMLRHPIYAGAYAYGLHRPGRKNPVSGRVEGGKCFLPPEEVRVLIQDRVPAYISWEQYLAHQRRISENRSFPSSKGAARGGKALLSGLIVCGGCGRHMNIGYCPEKTKKPHYWCDSHLHEERERPCSGLKAPPVDELVAQQVLRALEPAAVDLSLHAATDIERERERLHQHWRQRLERAHYDVGRAERQYQSVEPENRLVVRTLERRWEESLHQERQLREEYDRFVAETPTGLSDADAERIRAASRDISALWRAADTTCQDRKAIVRCLVDRVVVRVEPRSEYVDATIYWHGGFTSQHQVVRPVGCYTQLRDHDLLMQRIKTLHQEGKTVPAIADRLNEEGFVPPRRRGVFSVGTVAPIMQRLGLVGELNRDDLLGADEWWIRDLAIKLKVRPGKVHYWATQGWIRSRKTFSKKHWIVWVDDDELKRLQKLKVLHNSYTAKRNPQLVTPKARQE